jgi:hypothetical protein
MKYIISTKNGEGGKDFEEGKVFESEKLENTYNYLAGNASKGRLAPFEVFKKDIELNKDLKPVYGFYLQDEDNQVLYMRIKE